MSTIITLFGTHDGVGKTWVAANLAAALAQRFGKSSCLVDLDVSAPGHTAKQLNLTVSRSLLDLMPAAKRGTMPDAVAFEQIAARHPSGMHLIAGLAHGRQAGQLDPHVLPALLRAMASRYEVLLIDGGKAFSDVLLAACKPASLVVLVVAPEMLTRYQTKWALSVLESLAYPRSRLRVIVNREVSEEAVRRDLGMLIPCEVLGHIPLVSAAGQAAESLPHDRVRTASGRADWRMVATDDSNVAGRAFVRLGELISSVNGLPDPPATPPTAPAITLETPMWSARLYTVDHTGGREELTDEIALLKRRIHTQLLESQDLRTPELTTLTTEKQWFELRQRAERMITGLLARENSDVVTVPEVRARLVKEIADEALGLGPLEDLLADPEVTDILVNGKQQVYVERNGRLELTAKEFVSTHQLRGVLERILAPLGRRIDESVPMVDARLPDGSRINAVIPPLSLNGPLLSIRKFSHARYTQDDLIKFGTLTPAMARFLRACVLVRKNMIISGGAGSGKTTLLNNLAACIPDDQRIVTIEDAAEFKLTQTHWVSLEARPVNIEGKGEVTMRDLFRNALRMRADRIIIGECRGAETLDMLQAMNTGHDGSMTTVHANSPRDVIARLDSMVLMSDVDLPVRAIREMVSSAVHILIHTARLSDGSRKITAISELVKGQNEQEIVLHDLFLFRQTGVAPDGNVLGSFVTAGYRPTFWDELKAKGIPIDDEIFPRVEDPSPLASAL